MKITAIAVAGLLCASSAFAQQGAPPLTQAGDASTPLFRVNSQFVILDALVEHKKTGALAGGLEASDFQLEEDGAPQTISWFSHDALPLSVVFLFDLTDTVQPILKPLADGASEVLAHLKPQDEVSVMVFSSHTELIQDFTRDRTLAAAAIEKASHMKTGDGTFIHEDMYEAVDQAMKSTIPDSRRVMVWLTDGTANLENSLTRKVIGQQAPPRLHTREESTDKLLHSGVVVSALIDRSALTDAIVVSMDANPLFFIGGARLGDIERYADITGGPVLKTTKKEVADRLSLLIDQLRGRYTLGYKPTASRPPGTLCRIRLLLAAKQLSPADRDLVVRTRPGYYR